VSPGFYVLVPRVVVNWTGLSYHPETNVVILSFQSLGTQISTVGLVVLQEITVKEHDGRCGREKTAAFVLETDYLLHN
jgi:hypothetical protein